MHNILLTIVYSTPCSHKKSWKKWWEKLLRNQNNVREWQKGSTDRPREVHSLRGIFEKLSDNIMKLLEIKGRNVKDVPNSERSNFCSLAQRVSHNHKTRSSAFNWMLYFRVSGRNLAEFRYIPLMKKGPTVSSRTQKSWMQVLPQFKEMLIFQVSAFSYFVIFSRI